MGKVRKNVLLVFGMALIAMFSCLFGTLSLTGDKISASAETIEYQDLLGLEDRTSWASGHADIVTFGLMDFSITEGNQYFKSSVSGCWHHGNTEVINSNNGVDILQYIDINGESARDMITANQTAQKKTEGTGSWLSNPAAWPIAVETGSDCWIRIDKTYFGGSFTFTFKEGFSLIRSDGKTISISNDILYTYTNGVLGGKVVAKKVTLSFESMDATKTVKSGEKVGELPAVPAKEGFVGYWAIDGVVVNENTVISTDKTATPAYFEALEYQGLLGLEDRAWGAHEGEYYFGGVTLEPFGFFNTAASVSATWHADTTAPITANNGVDIMQYIYVNGECARDLIVANYKGAQNKNSCGCWLSNPAAWPVYVETTTGSGIVMHLAKAYFGDTVTITFKAGFSLIRDDGKMIYVSNDVGYTYSNGVLTKDAHMLSFEGMAETRMLKPGTAIGELPKIPAEEGKIGVWQIDGVEIKAETAYNYGMNKTARLVYYEGTDIIDTIDMSNWGKAGGNDCTYIRIGNWADKDGNLMMSTAFADVHWQDHAEEASKNYGCDVMEYIYINGKSARAISTENGQTNTYGGEGKATTFPFTVGGIYAPIDVYTGGDEFRILVMTDYVTSENLVVTLKAGFRMATSDGKMLYLSKDFVFPYYTVTFDGVAKKVNPNTAVAEPTAPTKEETEGYTYTFDGWYNGETKWNFSDPVTESLTLTAKFIETEKEKFTVTFQADNGTTDTSVSVYVNSYMKNEQIPANPVKEAEGSTAYTFLHWSLDGENAYDFSAPVTQDITLKAIYTTKPLYTVTMGSEVVKVVEGEKVEKPADPTKEATAEYEYTFEGWYNGETKWDFENDTVTADIELTAKYTESKRKYTVSFNVTGNEAITLAPIEVEYGTDYDLSTLLDGMDVTAYTYTVTVDGEAVTSVNVVSDVTVDVVFTAKVYYTVTVGGVEQTVEEGGKAMKPETEPTKESTAEYDYTFDGWYNGETKWDFENDTVTGDVELTAKYTETKRKYTVSFKVTGNDAITLDPVEVEYGTTYDLSNLLEGKDVSGYSYAISVDGVEKVSFKVTGDTEVTVAFTAIADNSGEETALGCLGSIGSMTGVLFSVMALGVVRVLKKKEN